MHYYDYDVRYPMLSIALMQLAIMAAVVAGGILIFTYSVAIGLITVVASISLIAISTPAQIILEQRLLKFKDHHLIPSPILYGDIEDVDTADSLKIMPENVGGIYADGDRIILGSLKMDELSCPKSAFKFQKKLSGSLGNRLIIQFGNEEMAFFPKWNGSHKDHPKTQQDKVEWAYCYLQRIVSG